MQYNVVPKGDGRSGWKVEANGRTTSRHNKKRPAVSTAVNRASPDDVVVIHGMGGEVLERRRVR